MGIGVRANPRVSEFKPSILLCLPPPLSFVPADASTADFNSSVNDFPEFGPLRSFTPMVSQNGGRNNPFATGGSSNGYADRSSLRNSQDISMLLRSGMLMEAALLSSNASRMHVIHDAGGCMYAGDAHCVHGCSKDSGTAHVSPCSLITLVVPADALACVML